MNCCDSYGKCTQGANCPARPAQVAKSKPVDGGNFHLPEPTIKPLTGTDRIALGLIAAYVALIVAGLLYLVFADAFWAWAAANF